LLDGPEALGKASRRGLQPERRTAIFSRMMNTSSKTGIEIIGAAGVTTLANPGVTSQQLVWPGNSLDARMTVTRVTVAPGAEQPRHAHETAEQVQIIE
jgi:hypothetical protein